MSLDAVLKNLNKKLKVGSLEIGVKYQDIEKIPFSSYRLNYMTHGGIPLGRIAEFSGADGSGKTTTALDLIGQSQRKYPDKKAVFCDIEHTFDSYWANKLNVNTDNLVYYNPDSSSAEEVFNTLLEIIDTGEISICVLDSIGAMVSDLANTKEIGEKTFGGVSMALTEFSKKLTPILARTGTVFIGINQIRDDMNSMYGGTTTTGGRAWRHSCTTRLSFRKGNYVDDKGNNLSRACENPAGNIVNVDLVKSKVCPPDRKIGFYTLKYLEGIDYYSDTVDVAIKLGIINQAGAWFTIINTDTGEILNIDNTDLKFQGKSKLIEYLKNNQNIYEIILESLDIS